MYIKRETSHLTEVSAIKNLAIKRKKIKYERHDKTYSKHVYQKGRLHAVYSDRWTQPSRHRR